MDLTAEKERLLRRDADWAKVASEGRDVDRILAYWTDDAIVIPPGLSSVVGQVALRQYVEESMKIPGFSITWESKDATFSPDGQLAYMISRNEVTFNASDGTPITSEGRAVTIWRRKSDGEWRCAVDVWNAQPAA